MSHIIELGVLSSAVTGLAIVAVTAAFFTHRRSPKFLDVPVYGADATDANTLKLRYVQEADAVLREAYEKFKNTVFQVLTPDGPRLFLPRKFAHELKPYKRHEASGMKALADRHLGHYTTIDHESDIMLGAIKIDLNRNLSNFVGAVQQEVAYCFEHHFPPCNDWTAVDVHEALLRIVAQASARIFVGHPMCRSDEWLECSTKFATDVMIGGEKLKLWHPWLRPLAQYWIPEMTRIRGDHRRALELLKPELARRAAATGDESGPHHDMIEWMQQRAKKLGDKSFDEREMANLQMLTATAAIHTTRLAIIHALYDLAAWPEYQEPLREEVLQILASSDGTLQKQHLTQMKKLDSFMKESQRHSPPSVATYQRKLMIPISLSNGLHIPAGTVVQCNTNILEENPSSWGDPHAFDGFRFHRMRESAETANMYQFASPSYDSMQFGYGNDACPGRFFASNQIKIIMAHVLSRYEVKFGEGVEGRPRNMMFEVNVLADPTVKVLFRRR